MPIYDYRCRKCGKTSEVLLRSPDSYVKCPGCGSDAMEKLISASYNIKVDRVTSDNTTCCGRAERCEKPPCSSGETCHRE
jgi:putative FmdB family regulatory protein